MQNVLPKEFYEKHDTLTLAKQLLGCTLIHESIEGRTSGIIVETEAYLQNDPACHAYRKKSVRNAPMFENAGVSYVYLIYGLHHCFNIVSGAAGIGEVQAMGITPNFNFLSLNSDNLYCIHPQTTDYQIITTTRIGITQGADLPYRFYIEGNGFVSRK